jgi:gliding motility-associated-like protein
LAVYRDATSTGWAILKTNNGYLGFAARDNTGAFDFYFSNTTKVDDAQMHHVGISWDRTTGVMDMYVDGAYEGSKVMNVSGNIGHNSSLMLGYGLDLTGSPVYLNGEIDEFRMWSEVRSSGDIQTYMSTHLNPSSFPTLSVNFDFNELVNTNGWYDCVAGITAPFGTSSPSINNMGGPFTNFNFAYTWTNTSGNSQAGSLYQKSFNQNDTVVVSVGYCKYLCSDTVVINVLDCDTAKDPRDVAAVFAPTAFTPNGDSRNDHYLVKANAISYFDMTIYNRLGNILFHSRDITTGWDGTFEDVFCREGVYVAKIIYRDIDGQEFTKYQQFSLMR